MYQDLLEPHTGKKLGRFDPERGLLEIQRRGEKTVFDLNEIKENANERQEEAKVPAKTGS